MYLTEKCYSIMFVKSDLSGESWLNTEEEMPLIVTDVWTTLTEVIFRSSLMMTSGDLAPPRTFHSK